MTPATPQLQLPNKFMNSKGIYGHRIQSLVFSNLTTFPPVCLVLESSSTDWLHTYSDVENKFMNSTEIYGHRIQSLVFSNLTTFPPVCLVLESSSTDWLHTYSDVEMKSILSCFLLFKSEPGQGNKTSPGDPEGPVLRYRFIIATISLQSGLRRGSS